MKDWCDRRKIKLVIAILPDQFQVDQALREAVLNKYKHIAEKNLDLSHPDNLIMNFCRTHNIHCLDMLGQFQEQGKTGMLYASRDTHWNEAGNRLAADLIFEYLEKIGYYHPGRGGLPRLAGHPVAPGGDTEGRITAFVLRKPVKKYLQN